MIKKVCEYCGAEFLAKTSAKKYCSDKCAASASYEFRKSRVGGVKKCKVCGQEFTLTVNKISYCSDECAQKAREERKARRAEEAGFGQSRRLKPGKYNPKAVIRHNRKIAEISSIAKAQGLTYGQYRAVLDGLYEATRVEVPEHFIRLQEQKRRSTNG